MYLHVRKTCISVSVVECYIDCVPPPKFICRNIIPSVGYVVFGRSLGHEGEQKGKNIIKHLINPKEKNQ